MAVIGILAGMGPRTTAPFIELVLDEAQKHGATFDADYPPLLIYSLPTPFYLDRPMDHKAMREALSIGLKALLRGGMDILAIPCNTIHIYFDYICNQVASEACKSIQLLHIIDATLAKIAPANSCIALLGTDSLLASQLYQPKLVQMGKKVFHTPLLQALVSELIAHLKAEKFSPRAAELWQKILCLLEENQCSQAVLACTELSLCIGAEKQTLISGCAFIDSTQALAEATFSCYQKLLEKKDVGTNPALS